MNDTPDLIESCNVSVVFADGSCQQIWMRGKTRQRMKLELVLVPDGNFSFAPLRADSMVLDDKDFKTTITAPQCAWAKTMQDPWEAMAYALEAIEDGQVEAARSRLAGMLRHRTELIEALEQ